MGQIREPFYFIQRLFLWLLLLAEAPLAAQSVNLQGYLDLVKKGNISIRQTANEISMAEQDRLASKSAFLPQIGTEFNYQRDFSKTFLFINDETGVSKFRTNFTNNIDANLLLEQPLFDPSITVNYRISQLAKKYAQLHHSDLSQALVHQAAQLYWQTIFSGQSISVLEDNKDLALDQWQQFKDLFEQGFVSELQMNQSESYFNRSIIQLQTAQNAHEKLINELKALAGLSPEYPLVLSDSLEISDHQLDQLMVTDTALSRNPGLLSLDKQVELANQQQRASKAAKSPTLKMHLGYNLNAQDNNLRFENDNQLWFGQLTLQIPLFTGGYHIAQIEKARIQEINATLALQKEQLRLKKELENARLEGAHALRRIHSELQAIRLSQKELDIANLSLELESITAFENKEIRAQYTRARLRLINAYLDLRLAQLKANRILGIIL